jgi:hypothetical protein
LEFVEPVLVSASPVEGVQKVEEVRVQRKLEEQRRTSVEVSRIVACPFVVKDEI